MDNNPFPLVQPVNMIYPTATIPTIIINIIRRRRRRRHHL
jgi:hypothetical protein